MSSFKHVGNIICLRYFRAFTHPQHMAANNYAPTHRGRLTASTGDLQPKPSPSVQAGHERNQASERLCRDPTRFPSSPHCYTLGCGLRRSAIPALCGNSRLANKCSLRCRTCVSLFPYSCETFSANDNDSPPTSRGDAHPCWPPRSSAPFTKLRVLTK
jgi:hypothetical protein